MSQIIHKPHPHIIGDAACGLTVLDSIWHRLQIKDQEITCVNCASIYTSPSVNKIGDKARIEELEQEVNRLKLFIAEQAHYIYTLHS